MNIWNLLDISLQSSFAVLHSNVHEDVNLKTVFVSQCI